MRLIAIRTYTQTYRNTDLCTNLQNDRQIDRQTSIHTNKDMPQFTNRGLGRLADRDAEKQIVENTAFLVERQIYREKKYIHTV